MTPPTRSLAPADAVPRDAARVPARAAADRLLTPDELAERWSVPRAQVYRLTRDGRLPAVRIGRYYRYSSAAINAWERSGGVAANE